MRQYYVRMRGQVSGPYSVGELQNLRTRGQFGRFHEISVDQQQWSPAGSVAELFPHEATAPAVERTLLSPAPAPARDVEAVWYYLDRNFQPQGPVSMSDLQALRESGRVEAETYVCKQGLPEWVPLDTFPRPTASPDVTPPKVNRFKRCGNAALLVTVWVVGCVLAPLAGVVGTVSAVALAADRFKEENQRTGWGFLALGLAVTALTGLGVYLLLVENRGARE